MDDRVLISENPGTVVLVHGLWLHGVAFLVQRHWLSQSGFSVRTFSYPSMLRGLDANSRALANHLCTIPDSTINLVGHSLGGLVVLNMFAQTFDPRIRRVVLMGSPCGGSHCASVLLNTPGLSVIAGRSLRDATKRSRWEIPEQVDIGLLSGSRSFGLGRIIPGLPYPNDGVVALEETRLAGCRDAITLPVSHSEMLVSRACTMQLATFIKTGRFFHA